MDFYDILFAKKLSGGGGGGSAVLINKNISANGTYNASSDNADGYKKVVVSVPNSYVAGDEGKVVSNGALVSQTSETYTTNNTYDTTLVNSVTVNVSGGISVDDIAKGTEPSGAVVLGSSVTSVDKDAFHHKIYITSVTGNYTTAIGDSSFRECTGITQAFFPNLTSNLMSYAFGGCTSLLVADVGKTGQINNNAFNGCSALRTLIIRKTSVPTLQQWNVGTLAGIYSNPSASTIYAPESIIASLKTASNWSSAYSAGVTFTKLEGSIYE